MCDEIAFAGCAVHRVVLIGKEPLLLSGLRVDEGYSHAVCKCPYHTEIIGINLLYLCQRLTRALYVDDIKLEGARVIDDHTQIGCQQELVTCIFQFVDTGYAFRHRYHGESVLQVIFSQFTVFCSQEHIFSHPSDPFERQLAWEFRVVYVCAFVGKHPFSSVCILVDVPYISASESLFSYFDEFYVKLVIRISCCSNSYSIFSCNPCSSVFHLVYPAHAQVYIEHFVYSFSQWSKLA